MTPSGGLTQVIDPEVEALVSCTRTLVNQAHSLSSSISRTLDDLTDLVAVVETGREFRHAQGVDPGQERRRATGE